DRVAADAHRGRLAEAVVGQLLDRLVGEGAGAAHHADAAGLVDVAGHDADLALVRRDDAGAVGAHQAHGLALEVALHLHHVLDGDALGDGDDERDARLGGLHDGVGRERRRHEDHGGVGAGGLHGLAHGVEARHVDLVAVRAARHARAVGLALEAHRLAALAGAHGADHVGAVGDRLVGVEGSGLAEALHDLPGVGVDEYALCTPPVRSTILRAPYFMTAALTTIKPD